MKKKLSLLIVAMFVTITTMQAQNWSQIGADIDGEAANDYSGKSVSFSADGSIMAIGAEDNDGNGAGAGHVRVYQNQSGAWIQIGADIDGEAAGDGSGISVSLNANGTIVAIGAIGNDGGGNYAGHVRVYQNQSGTWTQIGADIDGQAANNVSGWSVSLNASGTIVAIGATIISGGLPSYVRIFENQAGTWTQIGANIVAGAGIYKFGYSVSLSSDGSIVAIGAIENAVFPAGAGHVWVYQNISGTWTQIGADIVGEATNDYSGCSISLSSDGSILAIGADGNDGNGVSAGHVRVYQNQSGTWTQIGADIDGEAANDHSGCSVSLSADGFVVAIGAYQNDGNGADAGHVRVYQNQGGTWTQLCTDIDGEAAGDNSGQSVSLSADGLIVAIGAPGNDDNGSGAGSVRVYEIIQTPDITQQPENQMNICINADVFFTVSSQSTLSFQWQVNEGSGFVDITNGSVYSNSTTATLNITGVTLAMNNYYYRCNLTNLIGTTTSFEAVLIIDNINPIITSTHSDQIIGNEENCLVILPDYTGNCTTTDNCDLNLTITQSPIAGTLISGASNTVTLRATDYTGNYSEVLFNVIIVDITNPVIISNHTAQIVGYEENCEAFLPDYTNTVMATDNCDVNLTITQSPIIGTLISGAENAVTLTVTDDSENYSEVSFNVVVEDNSSPVITSTHNEQIIYADNNCEATLPDYTNTVTATDNCDAILDIIQSPIAGTTISGATNTVTLTVTDDNGNYSEVSFNLSVGENTSPAITSTHSDQIVDAENNCQSALPDYTNTITANDNCDVNLDITQSPISGTLISGVTNTVTLTVTNDVGNYSEVSFNVLVEDNSNPVITSTHNEQIVDLDNNCEATLPDYTNTVIATDNCDAILDITQSPISGTSISGTTNQVTLTATDDNGNYSEVSFNVLVEDNTNPVIMCVGNNTVNADATHFFTVNGTLLNPILASDNCQAASVTNNINGTASLAGASFAEGTIHTIIWTITDLAGNENTCSFDLTVSQSTNTAPEITSTAPTTATVGQEYTYEVIATDTEFDVLTYSISNQPVGMIITDNLISWTPAQGTTSSGIVTVTVSDGQLNDFENFIVYVTAIANTAPEITSTAPTTATVGQEYTYEVIATDTEFDVLTYSISNQPVGMIITDNLISWTPAQGTTSSGIVTVTVSDGQLNDFENFIVYVSTVGILDLQQIGISIYPNPTTGLINIKDDELKITNIQITDNLGQAIQSFSNSQNLDLSHLQNGIYFIRIQTKNNVYIEKIIKF